MGISNSLVRYNATTHCEYLLRRVVLPLLPQAGEGFQNTISAHTSQLKVSGFAANFILWHQPNSLYRALRGSAPSPAARERVGVSAGE